MDCDFIIHGEWLRYLAELQSELKGENFIIYLVLLKLVEKLTKIKQKLISINALKLNKWQERRYNV